MIYLDIETSGLDINKNQILSIGAIDFFNENNTFYEECYLDNNKIDLHTLAYNYAIEYNINVDVNNLGSDAIADMLKVPREIKPHNALNGAKQNLLVYKKIIKQTKN